MMLTCCFQMLRLVNNAVDLSRLGGRAHGGLTPRVDLRERLESIGQSLQINADKRGVAWIWRCPQQPAPACVDPGYARSGWCSTCPATP